MNSLEGYSTLITGGGSGLGRAIVARFVEEGARVVVLDRNAAALKDLATQYGDRIATHAGDVRSLADNSAAVELALQRFGKLDTFVGNAGIWDFNLSLADLPQDRMEAGFDEVFGINVKGYLLGVKAALPALVRSKGSVVLTLSNAAFYPGGGGPIYTAAKHAVRGMVYQLAHELAPAVRVNGVAPGGVASDLRGAKALGMDEMSIKMIPLGEYSKHGLPLARLPEADEYTGAYVMLASRRDGGAAVGTIVQVDGGIGMRGLKEVAGGHGLAERFAA